MGRRLFLIALLLMAAAASSVGAATLGIPRYYAPFGVEEGGSEFCLRRYWPGSAAPFALGTAAAIHIGNTKSCIAGYYNGSADPGSAYRFCIPSWVAFSDKEGTLTGEAARSHAALSPGTAVSGFMRLIHRRMDDPVVKKEVYNFTRQLGWASIQLETGQVFAPYQLAGILMSELKHMAEAHLGREIGNAVIAVPRHLTYDGRGRVRFAGTYLAGFRTAKVVDEQIAAAAAHGHHRTKQGNGKVVLVLHVGGRTSHATIFKFVRGRTRLIQATDDFFFGGDDFTARIVDHFVELIKQQHGIDIRQDTAALLRLRAECERAKKALSDDQQEETPVQVDSFSASLTRAMFEELNRDLFDRALGLLDQVVMQVTVREEQRKGILGLLDWVFSRSRAAESRKALIDEIVLAGGSSRIPKIRELVKDYFHGRKPNPRGGVEPDDAVIHGALLLTRPEAARYIEPCFAQWQEGDPRFI